MSGDRVMNPSRRRWLRGLMNPAAWWRGGGSVPLPGMADPPAARPVCKACSASAPGAGPPCAAVCPEDIVRVGDDGLPGLDFARSGCTFCGDCAAACPHAVLESGPQALIRASITLDRGSCLAWSSTMCRACLDSCPEDAVRFKGLLKPAIDGKSCTRCGFCVGACPVDAIGIGV